MSEQKLRNLLSALPEEAEIAERAARARRWALAGFQSRDRKGVDRRLWRWAACLAPAPVLVAAFWVANLWRLEPLPWTPPPPKIAAAELQPLAAPPAQRPVRRPQPLVLPQPRLEVQWVLADGTRVQWTFSKDFSL